MREKHKTAVESKSDPLGRRIGMTGEEEYVAWILRQCIVYNMLLSKNLKGDNNTEE